MSRQRRQSNVALSPSTHPLPRLYPRSSPCMPIGLLMQLITLGRSYPRPRLRLRRHSEQAHTAGALCDTCTFVILTRMSERGFIEPHQSHLPRRERMGRTNRTRRDDKSWERHEGGYTDTTRPQISRYSGVEDSNVDPLSTGATDERN